MSQAEHNRAVPDSFGETLRRLRTRRGLKSQTVGEFAAIGWDAAAQLERTDARPTLSVGRLRSILTLLHSREPISDADCVAYAAGAGINPDTVMAWRTAPRVEALRNAETRPACRTCGGFSMGLDGWGDPVRCPECKETVVEPPPAAAEPPATFMRSIAEMFEKRATDFRSMANMMAADARRIRTWADQLAHGEELEISAPAAGSAKGVGHE